MLVLARPLQALLHQAGKLGYQGLALLELLECESVQVRLASMLLLQLAVGLRHLVEFALQPAQLLRLHMPRMVLAARAVLRSLVVTAAAAACRRRRKQAGLPLRISVRSLHPELSKASPALLLREHLGRADRDRRAVGRREACLDKLLALSR